MDNNLNLNERNKKVCLNDNLCENNVVSQNKDGFLPVFDDSVVEDVPTVEVYIATVTSMQHMSKYVQGLSSLLPLQSLNHLKRVKKKDLLICSACQGYPEKLLKDNGIVCLDSIRILEVSSVMPKTRKQYEVANNLWPVSNFHENIIVEKKLAGLYFNADQRLQHEKCMRIAIEAARRSEINIGAVVVDPTSNTIIAVGGDDRLNHPLKHATMVAVDLVARSQGGGAWNVGPLDFYFEPQVVDTSETAVATVHKKRNGDHDVSKPDGPYLCTGYDVYITREPCAMCAMALLHSRVRRVFYGCSTDYGALGSVTKVHLLQDTNHRFEVFKNVLKAECISLL